ncbi:MAG: hypothetical protein ABTA16_03375 [Niallia sp.]
MNVVNITCKDCNEVLAQVKSPVAKETDSNILCVTCASKRAESK